MRGARPRLLLLAFWLVPAVVATIGFRVVPSRLNPSLGIGALFACQLAMWSAWGVWSLAILALGARVPFQRGQLTRAVLAHAALCVAVVTAQILVVAFIAVAFGLSEPRSLESTLAIGLRVYGDMFVVIFWGIVGAQVAFRWYAAWQAQSVMNAQLGQDLAEAQLRALQAQLNPHFLFNALNSVMTLIPRDAPAAQRMLVQLADLLRATLKAGEAQEVTLAQELEVTARYLEIEQVRFADRLTVRWDLPNERTALVPAFALQPLVENALVHGVARRTGAGEVSVVAQREGSDLVLRVHDNGADTGAPLSRAGAGAALANLRARLARLHGAAASLELSTPPEGGTDATLRLPYREAPGAR